MDSNIAKIWTDALRSGEYQQARGALTHIDENGNRSFCCLGVLCDLAIKQGLKGFVPTVYKTTVRYDDEANYLPKSVKDWAKMRNRYGSIDIDIDNLDDYEEKQNMDLAELNDEGKTFKEIADIIDKNVEKL